MAFMGQINISNVMRRFTIRDKVLNIFIQSCGEVKSYSKIDYSLPYLIPSRCFNT